MKKNDWSILISVVLYSILFYKQTAGVNFLIFNLAVVVLLLYRDPALRKSKTWLPVALGAAVSSFFIYMYGSALAIWANVFSLLILSAISINPQTSFLTGIFLTVCATGSSCVFMFIDWVKRKSGEIAGEYRRPFYVKIFLVVVPLLIAILFFFFYQASNPLFYNFTKDINLDFISIGWIFFTYTGLLLMYGFFHSIPMKDITEADATAPMTLTQEAASRKSFFNGLMRQDTEMVSGLVLFSMLNALLLLLNVLDLHYLWFDGTLPAGMKPKEFVHDGIGTLITSIIIAILILLFYFRGGLNFYRQNKWIRIMAYLWILQNVFMIFSTAYRNNLYIVESGLSYKKIGVYVYLLLTFIGLITTFIKVWRIKTNWYLFRMNAAAYYYLLVFFCVFNWDVIITNFNIRKYTGEKKELEKYLLLDLSFKNLPQLLSLPDSVINTDDLKARDYYYALRGVYFYDFKSGLDKKLYNFLEEYNAMEWPSACFEKKRVYHEISELKSSIRSLQYENSYMPALRPLQLFSELHQLRLNGCALKDLSELKMFPRLERLSLQNNQLDTIAAFPPLVNLRELNLSGNTITDISPLRKLRNLESLDLSGGNPIESFAPLLGMKKLRRLAVGQISPESLEKLKKLLPSVQIDANVGHLNSRE